MAPVSGATLNVEQKTSLESSLAVLQKNNKLSRVEFWGKVNGIKADYMIAIGYPTPDISGSIEMGDVGGADDLEDGANASKRRRVFASTDGLAWVQLPHVEEDVEERAARITSPFTGNPSTEVSVMIPADKNADPETVKEGMMPSIMTEEVRLAGVIAAIDESCSAVPRGCYMLTPDKRVVVNPTWSGLKSEEAQKLSQWIHLRKAVKAGSRTLLEKESLDPSLDFSDPLDSDSPSGVWVQRWDGVTGTALLKSLAWPGYTAYHVANTRYYGGVYFGNGIANQDLGFCL